MKKTQLVSDYATLANIVFDPAIEVLGTEILSNNNVMITHKFRDDRDAGPGNTSSAVAAMVTCHARIKLYHLMQQVESVRRDRVIYADTGKWLSKYRLING